MLSESQKQIKIKRIIYTVKKFLESDCQSLEELAQEINIPSSSIQRYLKEKQIIETYFGEDVYIMIRERIQINKQLGNEKGGVNYVNYNSYSKDENGKFTGSRRRR